MSEPTRYTGGCHCGNVRYAVSLDLSQPVLVCNCSMCARAGTMLAFVPEEQLELLRGEEWLSEYRFNKKVIAHLFCKNCGIKPFSRGVGPDGKRIAAVNVRCLDDVDLDALTVRKFDGKRA